jgi:hypothetical protein
VHSLISGSSEAEDAIMQLAYSMVRVDWASQAGLDLANALLYDLGWGFIKYGRDDFDQGYRFFGWLKRVASVCPSR